MSSKFRIYENHHYGIFKVIFLHNLCMSAFAILVAAVGKL